MEHLPSKEEISYLNFDDYLDFLTLLNTYNGRVIEDENHIFFVWCTEQDPQLQNIDGVALDALYEKNVIEGGMSVERFHQYCVDHDFLPRDPEKRGEIIAHFNNFLEGIYQQKKVEYETWAQTHDIDVSVGALTTFIDKEGNRYRVRTDYDHYGEIVT